MSDIYPEVIKRYIGPEKQKWFTYLSQLKVDNLGVARRGPISERIEKEMSKFDSLFKQYMKLLHPGLREQEATFRQKVKRPKSRYSYKVFLENAKKFDRDNRLVKWHNLPIYKDWFPLENCIRKLESMNLEFPFLKSTSSVFNQTGLDLSKGAGLPEGGPKRLQLAAALAYWNKIVQDPSTAAFKVMPGYRTQTERDDGTPKVRLVWGIPISEWVGQQTVWRSSIENTVRSAQDSVHSVLALYCTPDHALKCMKEHFTDTRSVVVFDSSAFDTTVKAEEIVDTHTALAEDNAPALNHLIDYMLRAPVVLPDGDLNKYGGMDSGCVTTNGVGDGANNLRDICAALAQQNLLRYVIFISVNGDDIAVFFNTVITVENIEKVSKFSSREINPEKSEKTENSVFFSKVFYCQEYWCKPMYLVLNSIMFREHEADALTGSKEYTAVVIAQQCEYLKNHPIGDKIVREIKRLDKYPIESFDKSQIQPALDLYKSKHNWMDETGQMEEMATLQDKGFYANC